MIFNFKGLRSWTCDAKTRNGTPCKNYQMANGRCRMHGGKSLAGEQSATYIHGRYVREAIGDELTAILEKMNKRAKVST